MQLSLSDYFGLLCVLIEFDAPALCSATPNWIPDGGSFGAIATQQAGAATVWFWTYEEPAPTEFIVPIGANGFRSLTNGGVVPGIYPVT